jgi:hypothetical protein
MKPCSPERRQHKDRRKRKNRQQQKGETVDWNNAGKPVMEQGLKQKPLLRQIRYRHGLSRSRRNAKEPDKCA